MRVAAGLAGAAAGYGFSFLVLIVLGLLFPNLSGSMALLLVETPIASGVIAAIVLWRRTDNALVKQAAGGFALVGGLMFLLFTGGG